MSASDFQEILKSRVALAPTIPCTTPNLAGTKRIEQARATRIRIIHRDLICKLTSLADDRPERVTFNVEKKTAPEAPFAVATIMLTVTFGLAVVASRSRERATAPETA